MPKRRTWFASGLSILLACGVASSSTEQPTGRQAVHVVAVKDSGLLTMCPTIRDTTMSGGGSWKPDGRAMSGRFADDLQLLRFPPREPGRLDSGATSELRDDPRFRTELGRTQAILPTPWTSTADAKPTSEREELGRNRMAEDRALEVAVERELLRLDRVDVVDTLEAADLVLLVEASYVALATSVTPDTAARAPDQAPAPLGTMTHLGDWQPNVLQSILAIAVPAEVYRATRGSVHAILKARTWEGSEVYQTPYQIREHTASKDVVRWESRRTWQSASPEAVVWQFFRMKPRPSSHPPICAASDPGFEVAASDPPSANSRGPEKSGTLGAPSKADPRGSRATFTGGVTHVSVPVTVTDRSGRPVVGLNASRFRVYEDETAQVIDRVDPPGAPVDVVLLVDSSASLRHQTEAMRAGTIAAIGAFDRLGELSIVSFDRRVVLHSRLPDHFSHRRPGSRSPSVGRSATRLFDAIELVLANPRKDASRRLALVVLTDGVDTASRLADAGTVLRRLGESHVPAYVFHYDTSQDNLLPVSGSDFDLRVNDARSEMRRALLPGGADDPDSTVEQATRFLSQIAAVTSGRLLAAPGPDDLATTFGAIAGELREQYTVAYYPTNQERDGTYRRIRVEVDGLDVTVRARPGYYQASSASISRKH